MCRQRRIDPPRRLEVSVTVATPCKPAPCRRTSTASCAILSARGALRASSTPPFSGTLSFPEHRREFQPMNVPQALPGADFLNPSEIKDIQCRRWAQQADYVNAHSTFFRTRLAATPLSGRLAELVDIPFTDKEAVRDDQRLHPPFGSYLASEPHLIARVHRTSGTTGVAMNLALSRADAEMTAKVGARAQCAAGLGPGQRVVHCLNYRLWMGGFTDHATLEETGATVVPFGVGGSEELIRVIRDLGITAISCTPSYPAVLEQVIAEHFPGMTPRALGLKLGLFGGEAGLDEPQFRQRLERTWGFAVRNANYGVSDVLCNFAGQSEVCDDLHFLAPDVLFPQLIDPDSGQARPWKEGESGELVLTHLAKQCQPLVRFRTGDIVRLTATGRAACGRWATRFRVMGRSDDMVIVRGLNVFPAMLTGIVHQFNELSGEYRVVLRHPPPYDTLPIEVELATTLEQGNTLVQTVQNEIKKRLGVTARVELLPARSLPLTAGKTRRVERRYA